MTDLTRATWRKSSRSNGTGGECVELASVPGVRAIRDSKNSTGPALVFSPEAVQGFLVGVQSGRYDR